MVVRGRCIVLNHGTVDIWHNTEPRTVHSEMLETGAGNEHNDWQEITIEWLWDTAHPRG